ncbi:hypothetical protein HYFRA_00000219 [Hymenoscyphus fraxineus]|uniref:Uncharacterized protein n=1 Tax=Hymenoscyphus fraxineus TaxID=746836 RepID=A0A9N9L2G2_9HELO|nr:hypothetical protein HYFRA_00000219 [Hymenoscyphus fraxineus]
MQNLPLPIEVRQEIYKYLFQPAATITMEEDWPCFEAAPIETALFRVNSTISAEAQAFFKKRGFMGVTLTDSWTTVALRHVIPSRQINKNELSKIPMPLKMSIIGKLSGRKANHHRKTTHLIIDLQYLNRMVDFLNSYQANIGAFDNTLLRPTSVSIQRIHLTLNDSFDKLGLNSKIYDNCVQQLKDIRLGPDSNTDPSGQPVAKILTLLPLPYNPKQKDLLQEIMTAICKNSYSGQASIPYARQLQDKAEAFWEKGDLWNARAYSDMAIACFSDRYSRLNPTKNQQFGETLIDLLFQATKLAFAMGQDAYLYAEKAHFYVRKTEGASLSTEQTFVHYNALRAIYLNTLEHRYFKKVLQALEAAYILFTETKDKESQGRILEEFDVRLVVWTTDPKNYRLYVQVANKLWERLAPTLTSALEALKIAEAENDKKELAEFEASLEHETEMDDE